MTQVSAHPKHFLSDKVEHFTESVIREMTRQAMQYDAVNLAQGFPDFPAPAEIKRAAQEAIAAETVRIIASYKNTGKVPNVVNLAKKTPATHMLVVRHRDRPGVLAHVFDRLRSGNINAQETENVIFEGAQAAVARINLDGAPPDALLQQMQAGNSDILDLHLVTI